MDFSYIATNFSYANYSQRKKKVFELLLHQHRAELEPLLIKAQQAVVEKTTDLFPHESLAMINCVLATLADSFGGYSKPKIKFQFSSDSGLITFDESMFAPVNGLTVQEALADRLALLKDVDSPENP